MKVLLVLVVLVCTCDFGEASVSTQYKGLAKDYKKWKENSDPTDFDPVVGYSKTKVQNVCRSFLFNDYYKYFEDESDSPSSTATPESVITNKRLVIHRYQNVDDFKPQQITLPSVGDSALNVFQCATDENYGYYMTYGYRENLFFILRVPQGTDTNKEGKIEFFSLIQRVAASVEDLSSRPIDFLHSFWGHYMFEELNSNQVKERTGITLPQVMSLCSLNENQHFNLCSISATALRKELEFFYLTSKLQRFNTIRKIRKRCIEKTIIDEERNLTANFKVLPCAIGQDWSEPQFYLLNNPLSDPKSSVFVLKPKENDASKLKLITRINDLGFQIPERVPN